MTATQHALRCPQAPGHAVHRVGGGSTSLAPSPTRKQLKAENLYPLNYLTCLGGEPDPAPPAE